MRSLYCQENTDKSTKHIVMPTLGDLEFQRVTALPASPQYIAPGFTERVFQVSVKLFTTELGSYGRSLKLP